MIDRNKFGSVVRSFADIVCLFTLLILPSGLRRSAAPYFIYYSSIVAVSSRISDRVRLNRSMDIFRIFLGSKLHFGLRSNQIKKEKEKNVFETSPDFCFNKKMFYGCLLSHTTGSQKSVERTVKRIHLKISRNERKKTERKKSRNKKKTKHRTSRLILIKSPD